MFGHVVGIYIADEFIEDGLVNSGAMQPIARMGYMQYAAVRSESIFEINRPKLDEDGNVVEKEPGAWDGQYR